MKGRDRLVAARQSLHAAGVGQRGQHGSAGARPHQLGVVGLPAGLFVVGEAERLAYRGEHVAEHVDQAFGLGPARLP